MTERLAGSFGQLLRQLRADAGLTQEELATIAGLSTRAVSDLERGINLRPRKDTARRLADALSLATPAQAEFLATARRDPGSPAGGAAAVMRTLPRDVVSFTGREGELAQLVGESAKPGVHLIGGMAGVGKTALAVHAGHLAADRFPDRRLFVDLHGHTPGQRPADPADVLAMLLAADGVDARYLPGDLDSRAAMWRDRTEGKGVLLVLDNAASTDQVTPLLPGTADCLVLVTSRRYLSDLPQPAAEISLDTLPPGDASAMFSNLAPQGAQAPAALVAELVALCGHLPLAISLLARLLARHQSWTIEDLIEETKARLLTVTAENRTVAAAFELSYQYLTAVRQRFFRQLSLHPGADFDLYASAALTGLPLDQAGEHLDALHSVRLLNEPVRGRYKMHDLIGQYARSLAADDSAVECEQAAERLLDYYQQTAETADARLALHTRPVAVAPVRVRAVQPELTRQDLVQAWMTIERANLLACIDYAATHNQHARVVRLTAAIASDLCTRGPWGQAITLFTNAAKAAQLISDQHSEANALTSAGIVRRMSWDTAGAAQALERAQGMFRSLDNPVGEANALYYLAGVRYLSSDYAGGLALLERAVAIFRGVGDRLGVANATGTLGGMRLLTGDYPGAVAALRDAQDILRGIERHGGVNAASSLGVIRLVTGDYPSAAAALDQLLAVMKDAGDRFGESNVLYMLGAMRQVTGEYIAAVDAHEEAIDIFRDVGNRLGEANALLYLGVIRHQTGDYPAASAVLRQALDIFRSIGDRHGEANARLHLGVVQYVTGEQSTARTALELAKNIFGSIADRLGEASTELHLGVIRYKTGDYPAAGDALQHAMDICRSIGDRLGEAEALNHLGSLHFARGLPDLAYPYYLRALELARLIGSRLEEARALEGTGKCARRISSADTAEDTLRNALEIYQDIGAADAPRLAAEMGDSPETRSN